MPNPRHDNGIILGINAYHGDSSACILKNGQMIAGIEEERLRRIKHWAGFPSEAIKYCLSETEIELRHVDHIAFSRNPMSQMHKKIWFALKKRPSVSLVKDRLANMARIRSGKLRLSEEFGVDPRAIQAKVHSIEHHLSHSASAFLVSPFDKAAVVSIDAFGDFKSTLISVGEGHKIKPFNSVGFPHSLGLLYTAVTQFLGFPYYGDEYKVMGLASYGDPVYIEELRKMIKPKPKGRFELNIDYFLHATDGVKMSWNNCAPEIDTAFSPHMELRLGPARRPDEPVTQKHKDIASSLQRVMEEIYFHVLNYAQTATNLKKLALAGGVAFNSVANGKIYDHTEFNDIYIQSAAGDAGTSLGAAVYVHNTTIHEPKRFVMNSSYWGPSYSDEIIKKHLDQNDLQYFTTSEDEVISYTASAISEGKIVGWFQGRAEWGPRALGNRSILCDPRRQDMKEILNQRIKRREDFRPFAPSILLEATDEYFEKSHPDPFMLKVYSIKQSKRNIIPAVTHIDGSGRLQTVNKNDNPRYWKLLKAFEKITGVPVLLNTSFNENEPMVCNPEEAIRCFVRANIDILVLGNHIVMRQNTTENKLETPDPQEGKL